MIEEHKFIFSNVDGNNNKFWIAKIYEDFSVEFEWGRVGSVPQTKRSTFNSLDNAKSAVSKKIREKENKGYKRIEIVAKSINLANANLSDVAQNQIQSETKNETTKLIALLSKENIHNILTNTVLSYDELTGLFSTPLGIVTDITVKNARKILDDMLTYVKNKDFTNEAYKKLINNYLTLIPSKVSYKLNASTFLSDEADVQKQYDILDSLMASYDEYTSRLKTSTSDTSKIPEIFKCSINLVSDMSIINRISKLYESTIKDIHSCSNLKVAKVYEISIDNMKNNFVGDKIGNVQELWHGTKISNILSIFKSGLVIVSGNDKIVTGSMFGRGLYFSDISTKALNYSYGYWSNSRNSHCFMFLADVAMGKSYTPKSSSESLPKAGYDSTFAKPGESGIINNEMIVYNVNQVNLKYLVEFTN